MNIKQRIGKRIKEARNKRGITIKELAAEIGDFSPARIGNWEQGTRCPGPSEIKILASHLSVSASYLLCFTDNQQGEITHSLDFGMRNIPILSLDESPHYKEVLPIKANIDVKNIVVDSYNKSLKSKYLFAVEIKDNSMEPKVANGSVVVVDASKRPNPGDLVLAFIESKKQTVLRKYGESAEGQFQLLPENELWASLTAKVTDQIHIVGVAVEIRMFLY